MLFQSAEIVKLAHTSKATRLQGVTVGSLCVSMCRLCPDAKVNSGAGFIKECDVASIRHVSFGFRDCETMQGPPPDGMVYTYCYKHERRVFVRQLLVLHENFLSFGIPPL